ncbi:ribonuclease H-like protein [Mycena vitilis]|nr:ribonuclease H-like protein [Mycena vitilis]
MPLLTVYYNSSLTSWRPECEAQIKGVPGAKHKSFLRREEAAAWISGTVAPAPVAGLSGGSSDKGKKRRMSPDVEDESTWDVVYSDGACKGNGQANAVAGVGVWYGANDPRNIAERCPGDQTNNRAELIAIVRVLEETPPSKKPLLIKSDSTYSIKCFKEWLPNWIRNGWVTSSKEPVKNAPLIKYLSAHLDARALRGQKVRLQYIKAHVGFEGNEGADYQANLGAREPLAKERDWVKLEADLRKRLALEQQSGRGKPQPVPLEVADEEAVVTVRAPDESRAKIRKVTVENPSPKKTVTSPSKPLARSSPPVPLQPPKPVIATSSASQIIDDDLFDYADCLLDGDDLLAELSD